MNFQLNVAWLYPDLMSTYGDRGNIIVLKKRCQERDIDVEIKQISLNSSARVFKLCDLIFMGGAQDRQQKLVGDDFVHKKGPVIKDMIEKDIPALFVCAAYQFAGHFYLPFEGDKIGGAGIFDLYTKHPGDQAKRLIGNIAAELLPSFWGIPIHSGRPQNQQHIDSGQARMTIIGFENHGGRTYLGPKMKPLAKVIKGYGNNGEDGYEGAVYKNAIGSYFHGPILPKNPHLADWLIAKALEVKYQKIIQIEPLYDNLEWQAHNFMLKKLSIS